MPVSLTVKNLPDDIYLRLKLVAEANHRSMNGQVIASLSDSLTPPKKSAADWLAEVDAMRVSISKSISKTGKKFTAKEIDTFKRQGRK